MDFRLDDRSEISTYRMRTFLLLSPDEVVSPNNGNLESDTPKTPRSPTLPSFRKGGLRCSSDSFITKTRPRNSTTRCRANLVVIFRKPMRVFFFHAPRRSKIGLRDDMRPNSGNGYAQKQSKQAPPSTPETFSPRMLLKKEANARTRTRTGGLSRGGPML